MNPDEPRGLADALRNAAYDGNLSLLSRLVDEAVDVNIWDKWGRTALSLAAGRGHVDVVGFLIISGAWVDPHEDYDTYETPLIAAADSGHLAIVRILIEAGANPRLHGGRAQAKAEFYARRNRHVAAAAYLAMVEMK